MEYQLIIRPEAELDIEEAFQWYEEQSIGLGVEFLRCLDASFDIIMRSPELYQKGAGSPNPRRHFVPSFGALICAPRIPVILGVPKKRLFFKQAFPNH